MTIIAPSLLSADFLNLEKEIKSFDQEKDLWFHLDIMDGHFVPNLTFGPTVLKGLSKITQHKLDAHFMVTNPQDHIEWFKGIGIHNFTYHWEANFHHDRIIAEIKKSYPSVGISLNPGTPTESIPDYILKKIDLVLIMSVNPGFGGQSFLEYAVDKVKELATRRQQLGASFQIQVDGGVNQDTATKLIQAGADNLVAGSYIFGTEQSNYSNKIKSIRGE